MVSHNISIQLEDIKDSLALQSAKRSQKVLRSGKQIEISLVEGRIAGVREEADFSGTFILRTVEIRRESGKRLGFEKEMGG